MFKQRTPPVVIGASLHLTLRALYILNPGRTGVITPHLELTVVE